MRGGGGGGESGGFWHPFSPPLPRRCSVGALLFIDELALKEPTDKTRFFKSLPGAQEAAVGGNKGGGSMNPSPPPSAILPKFPDAICKYRILPALMNALEFGAAGALGCGRAGWWWGRILK